MTTDKNTEKIKADFRKVSLEKTIPFLKENCTTLKDARELLGSLGAMLQQHMYRKESTMTIKDLGIVNDLKKIKPQTETTKKLIELLIPFEKLNYTYTVSTFSSFENAFDTVAKEEYAKEPIDKIDLLLSQDENKGGGTK